MRNPAEFVFAYLYLHPVAGNLVFDDSKILIRVHKSKKLIVKLLKKPGDGSVQRSGECRPIVRMDFQAKKLPGLFFTDVPPG